MIARRPSAPARGTGKKARWSAAQKAQQKSGVRAGARGPARQSRSDERSGASRFGGSERRFERTDRYGRDDRRDDQRDDRRENRYGRDERFGRDDRYRRDERGGYRRDERRGAERAQRDGRDSRGAGAERYGRSDRSERYGRSQGRDRFERRDDAERYERYDRRGRDDRRERAVGDNRRWSRDDRPSQRDGYRDDRHDRRRDRDERDFRGDRDYRGNRDSRGYHDNRGYRDRFDDRSRERGARWERREADTRSEGSESAGAERREFEQRDVERRDRFRGPREDRRDAGHGERRPDHTGSRLRQQERPVVEPVEVGADNAFAALGVPDGLVRRLARDGIVEPFPIQTATIPDALAGRDVLGRGRTGSGKTLAFGLPLLTRLAEGERAGAKRPRAVILSPTRELAMQISDALQPLVHVLGLRHKLVAGGMPYPPQFEALERGVDVLIATPGRLSDLVERGAADLGGVEIVVLDEADHMADMGFLEAITELLDQVPAGGQRLLFSATLDKGIDGLVERYLVDPVTHSTDEAQAAVTTMAHHILLVEPQHKKLITADVANRTGRTVVFVRTKLGADRVALQLREQGVFAAALHGGLNQGARNRVLAAFKSGEIPVLVATDVAARGIHVDDVSVVLQVDPPADHKDYLHRAGRTARAGEEGTVVTLALPHQRKLMQRIATDAGLGIEPVRVRVGDDTILAATGAQRPSGVPIPEERLRRLLEPPRRVRRPGYGPRRPGGSGPRRDRRPGPQRG